MINEKQLKKQITNKDKRVSVNHGKNRKDDKSIELTRTPQKTKKHSTNDTILFICMYTKYTIIILLYIIYNIYVIYY